MHYAIGDLHGCYEQYQAMLRLIDFQATDTLYVLGDVLDRGPRPIDILLDMAARPNVVPILGNHEYMAALVLEKLLVTIDESNAENHLDQQLMSNLQFWLLNGGQSTLAQIHTLSMDDRQLVADYLAEFSLYETCRVNGREYVMVHAGLAGFSPEKQLDDYELPDLLFTAPNYQAQYYPDKWLITGHTPTFKIDPGCEGAIYRQNRHIAIDCGLVYGKTLGAFCLDTEACFYVDYQR